MFGVGGSFYDNNGNFNNRKILKLLSDAQKKQISSDPNRATKKSGAINLFAGASQKEVWQVINKFSIFVNSWVDVKWALWILYKQTKNKYLKDIVIEMKNNLDHGITIHETMSQYPKIFDSLTVALIEVWEKTGQLWKILDELDTSLLENIELKGKVKWAMVYPLILLGLTICMVVFMMIFIVPKITEAFVKADVALPGLTQFVVSVSDFMMTKWYIIIMVIILSFIGTKVIGMFYAGRMFYARAAFNMPIFWYIVRQSNIIYFIKSFTLLLDAWVLLLEAIKTSSKVVPNLLYQKEVIRVKNEVEVGLTMSKSLWLNMEYEQSIYLNKYFWEEFAYVVNTWEETGTLSLSLKKIGVNYHNELKRYIANLATMMEPIIIVIVGALVGTIVIAIMLPFFEMWKVAKQL